MSDTENTLSIASSSTSGVYSEASGMSVNSTNTHIHRSTNGESLLERQDSVESLELGMSSSPSRSLSHGHQSDSSLLKSVDSLEVNGHAEKTKKDKKHFMRVFKRSKKSKDKHLETTLPAPHLGVSIGTAETKHSFSKLKNQRQAHTISHLTPPITHRPRSNSNSLDNGSYSDGDFSERELIATLINPTAAALSRSTSQLDSLGAAGSDSRPESQLSNYSGIESDNLEVEPKQYNVLVTLHSGHNLAIRDRTGSSDPYVKFKCGRFKYRSSVIHRNLNPEWNETFSFRTSNLKIPLEARVFDHDFGSLDDFMGGQSIDLEAYATSEIQIVDLGLECPVAAAKGENLGSIRLFIQVTPILEGEPPHEGKEKKSGRFQTSKGIQLWNSIVTVTILEGHDLPAMDENGLSDPYCKLKLGTQKYKSKVIHKSLNPKWMEPCGLRLYDGCTTLHLEVWDKDFPQSDDFIGSCSVELESLEKEKTHKMTLELIGNNPDNEGDYGSISILITITGTAATDSAYADMSEISKKYSVLKTVNLREKKDVGFLRVKVDHAENLPVMETTAFVELSNSYRLTQTVYKTNNPVWDKTFEFKVLDIHDELEVTIYKWPKKIGKIKIPVHRIQPGIQAYPLKNKTCLERIKGVVYLECELVYNPIRAAIRTINPREQKVLEGEEKFSRKVLMNNISRFTQLIRTILATLELIKSLWSWEDKTKSACAFIVFVIACLFGELWMCLLAGCFVFAYFYLVVHINGKHVWQLHHVQSSRGLAMTSDDSTGDAFSDFSDIEEELKSNKTRTNLRAKFKQLQEVLLIVQKVLGYIGDTEERVRNLFGWSVPFLCWMAIGVFLAGAVLFYLVPLRYVILIWGINKFSKRLLNPNYISNTELLDFLSRSPTNKQLEQWRQYSVHTATKTTKTSNSKSKRQKSVEKDKKRR